MSSLRFVSSERRRDVISFLIKKIGIYKMRGTKKSMKVARKTKIRGFDEKKIEEKKNKKMIKFKVGEE